MPLKTKCILATPAQSDGFRISVMNRHTLNDGLTPHPQIRDHLFDWHCAALAPSAKLLGDYYKRWLPWADFERRYLLHLQQAESLVALEKVIHMAESRQVTLLCIEERPHYCHRRLLAESCVRSAPHLAVTFE